LKIKRKVPHAAPRTPFGVPLQRRKAAQKQCADNHLRPKGARIENPLYLALLIRRFFFTVVIVSSPSVLAILATLSRRSYTKYPH
jgi:hypothetical protein